MNQLGEYVRKKRKEFGLSINELVKQSGVSKGYISQIENGFIPSQDVLSKIAVGLCYEERYMFGIVYKDLLKLAGYNADWYFLDEVSKDKIENQLRLLTDNQGYFLEQVREEVFNTITSNLYMASAYQGSNDHNEYENYFNNYFSASSDELTINDHKESEKMFNDAYNIRTVLKVINSSNTKIDELDKFNSELNKIIERHDIQNPTKKQLKEETELLNILNRPNLTYNNHLITENDCKLIKSYLDALFSNR